MPDQWRAWHPGTDPADLARANATAREGFLSSGNLRGPLRSVVADSWRRCLRRGVDPDGPAPDVTLLDGELDAYRDAHPLAPVLPVVRRLLVDDAADADLIVAVCDDVGRLLWVEGSRPLRRAAEGMHFVEGAVWSEEVAGTNAPGTSLALDHAIQIYGAEHLRSAATRWSCTAAPIHGPDGRLLGALDLTGGDEVAAPHTLRLVRAVVAAAEAELRAHEAAGPGPRPGDRGRGRRFGRPGRRAAPAPPAPAAPSLDVLGLPQGQLRIGSRTTRLRLRHSELLLVLAEHPGGLTAEQLEAALHERPSALVTARAEVSRLRRLLQDAGGPQLGSRPYRVEPALGTDAGRVREQLRAGRVAEALASYAGPALPTSSAPAVVRVRDELHHDLRGAVLAAGDAEQAWALARRPEFAWDLELWRACHDAQPPGSARRADAGAHLRRLEGELAAAG